MKCFVSILLSQREKRLVSVPYRRTMSDEAAKVPTNDAMPGCSCPRVELYKITSVCATELWSLEAGHGYLFLDILCNILLYAEFLKGSLRNFNRLLLHFFTLEIVSSSLSSVGKEARYHIRRFYLSWKTVSRVESTIIAGSGSYRPASPWSASRSP